MGPDDDGGQAGTTDEYVVVTVEDCAQELLRNSTDYEITGLDTPNPKMRLGGHELIGTYEEETTAMMFSETADASGEDARPNMALHSMTNLRLNFRFASTAGVGERPV
ncbi:hypothetical protein KFE25_012112 [Diacronema lutheri]|uniref:Transcription factor TFIIIC triple barrel domain-containing protein n=1 Tax=Diacronema lutheri TaxID=2081491 RepID=A0A8J6C546_DIALT|nr:hypothetical protein KFE25_012112 [Diacronema lutheri]